MEFRRGSGITWVARCGVVLFLVLVAHMGVAVRGGSAAGGDESILQAGPSGCVPAANTPAALGGNAAVQGSDPDAPVKTTGDADAATTDTGKVAQAGDSPTQGQLWNISMRTYPLCSYPVGAQTRAWEQLQGMPQSAVSGWRHQTAGPNPTLPDGTGQTPWSAIGPVGTHDRYFDFADHNVLYSGRVTSIAVDPTEKKVVYIGSSSGGVWKTIDMGVHWVPLTDTQSPSAWIGAVAIDPRNHNIVFAGTGNGAAFNGGTSPGAGLLRSVDAGKTWTVVRPDPTGADPFTKVGFSKIVPDPAVANRVWAITVDHGSNYWNSTSAGLYLSNDEGLTWTAVSGTTPSHLPAMSAFDLTFDPGNAKVMYVTMTDVLHNGTPGGVFRSSNDGQTWQSIRPLGSQIRSQLAIVKPASGPTILYASEATMNWGDPTSHSIRGLYRSTNGGTSWTPVTPPNGEIYPDTNILAADPTDPTGRTLYQGGVHLLKSIDGGVTWDNLTIWPFTHHIYTHADNHALVFSGSSLWVGNDGGVFRTDDHGITFQGYNATLGLTQFYSAATDAAYAPQVIGGTQDNGTQGWKGATSSLRWDEMYGGDGGASAIDPSAPNTYYEEYVDLDIHKSIDGGLTWNAASNGIPDNFGKNPNHACFIAPFIMDSSHPNMLLAGTGTVWQSIDRAGSWHAASPTLVSNGECLSSIAIAPGNHSVWYTGSSMGHIFRTDNAGRTWTDVSQGLRWGIVLSIAVDPRNAHIAYAAMSNCFDRNCLFKTTNGGTSWLPLNVNTTLPKAPIFSVVVDPLDSSHVYLGGEQGTFESLNGGSSWTLLSQGLPHVPVYQLVLNQSGTILHAATYGRGMWRIYRTWLVLTPAASAAGSRVTVTGHGFIANEPVALTVDGVSKPTGTADRNGTVTMTLTAPPAGTHPVVLRGTQSARTARRTLIVK